MGCSCGVIFEGSPQGESWGLVNGGWRCRAQQSDPMTNCGAYVIQTPGSPAPIGSVRGSWQPAVPGGEELKCPADPKPPEQQCPKLDREPSPTTKLQKCPPGARQGLRAFGRLPRGGDLGEGPRRVQMSLPNAGEASPAAGQALARQGQGTQVPAILGAWSETQSEGSSCP